MTHARPLALFTLLAFVPSALAAQPASPPPPLPPPVPAVTAVPAASPLASPSASPEVPAPATTPSAKPLTLGKAKVQLNPGMLSTLAIDGGTPPYRAVLDVPIATVTIDPSTQTINLRATAKGTATIVVTDAANATVTATLLVGPNAGFVAPDVPLNLFGYPSRDYVSAQVRSAVQRRLNTLPGTLATITTNVATDLTPGDHVDTPVRVHLDGAGKYVDVDQIASVHVDVAPSISINPGRLFYSDDPENVRADGVLFQGTIAPQHPVRLYYYHQTLAANRQLAIFLESAGSSQVTVIGLGAGPSIAVNYVGQTATYRYLDAHARKAGVAVSLPVGAAPSLLLGDRPSAAGELVAGVYDVAITTGDAVRMTLVAYSPGVDPRTLLTTSELPSDGYRRRGEYDLTTVAPIELDYRVTATATAPAPEPSALVGAAGAALPNKRPGGRALGGNYGVLYPFSFLLGNDTDAPKNLYLYEQPVTGYPVTTTIAFDGDPAPMRLQCVKTKSNRYLVRSFALAPHATQEYAGSYMTDGGSTYPLALGITATAPSPLPLTMTEADGCYPKPEAPPEPAALPATASPEPAPTPAASRAPRASA